MKMHNTCKRLSSLLFALLLTLGTVMPAFAAESTITYKGSKSGFAFAPGSVYTETDLFDNFKNVMPGDIRTETVTFTNKYRGCDYIKVWMSAVLHDEDGNVISPEVLAELAADDRKGDLSELEYMHDFLEQLTLTVWHDGNIIYTGSPNSLEEGFEDGEGVYLGKLSYKDSLALTVELAVDIEMGNEYANRIGEVDWVFVVEEHNNTKPTTTVTTKATTTTEPKVTTPEPDTTTTEPNVTTPEPVVTTSVPDITTSPENPELPQTGDTTNVLPYVLLFVAALTVLLLLIFCKKKKED